MTDARPSWEPSVSVVGLGGAGTETVETVATETAAEFFAEWDDAEAVAEDVADSDFCFLAGDLAEPGTSERAARILRGTDAHTVFFAEGATDDPRPIVEDTDLLVPIGADARREFVASALADLFECMLPPTLDALGYGDVLATTGPEQVGKLVVRSEDTRSDLTPGFRFQSPDSVLYFLCDGEEIPLRVGEQRATAVRDDAPTDASFLWDRRIHPRYEDRAHAKYVVCAEAAVEDRMRLLQS